ncbi:MAG TPA: FkbM family methyltransferase, partial [Bryobacteraceae bacterium]|nr:FkbM family methyltransferase [Bryobacteraceae bacterium]
VECLRRNFKKEIAEGRVIVMPEGVWDKESTVDLFIGAQNSGSHSMIYNQGLGSVKVKVDTLDHMRERLQLPRVDFIKTDIEGAEQNALRGAHETLRLFKPRLRMDSNHREDDIQRLPAVAREGNPQYQVHCGYCETAYSQFRPHVLLLE